jgi:hypothetical protein
MPQGNLLGLAQTDSSITEIDMLQMARQAAAGMSYLASQGIVHRFELVDRMLTILLEIWLCVICL